MKRYLLPVMLLALSACSNELRVNMDTGSLPVVYCILNLDDSVQFVRLAKSFFPEPGYGAEPHLDVQRWEGPVEIYLEEWKDPLAPEIHEFYPSDTIRQDTGYFNRPSFRLFESSFRPAPDTPCYLYVFFPGSDLHTWAYARTVGHPVVVTPDEIPGRRITFSDKDNFTVQIRPPVNSGYHSFSFYFTVEEHLADGLNVDYFPFGASAYNESSGQLLVYQLNSNRFYSDLLERYAPLDGDSYRQITGLEFIDYSFGIEMKLYNQLYRNGTQPWEIQTYSSFSNGFGLFSSVARSRITNLELSALTLDILTTDPRYKSLKFIR
jgi:hypothetical protein